MTSKPTLVVAAHPDDEVLGLGGTIARRARGGSEVHVVYLATGVTARFPGGCVEDAEERISLLHAEARAAGKVLSLASQTFLDFPDNRMDTVPRMEVARELKAVVEAVGPDTVFTHHFGDYNWDHRVAFEATMMACRACPGETFPRTILAYEVPSSTERAFQHPAFAFSPTVYVDIREQLALKQEALRAYVSETGRYPHPRSAEALEHLAAKRGNEVALRYAEAFALVRRIE